LAILIPLAFGLLIRNVFIKGQKVFLFENLLISLSLVFGLLAEFATFSRSGWFAVSISLLIMGVFLVKKTASFGFLKRGAFFLLLLFILFYPFHSLILLRLSSFPSILTLGTGRSRTLLIQEAIAIIKQNPIFGVGLNNFTQAMVQTNLTGIANKFLFPVHNTFLLFATEVGLPATILFTLFVLFVLVSGLRTIKKNWLYLGIWLGCLTFIFNSQFHTLFSQDPSFDLFMLLLGFLSCQSQS